MTEKANCAACSAKGNQDTSRGIIPQSFVDAKMRSLGISSMETATIRELSRLAREVEAESGVEFVHMEMGVPGLTPSSIGINAEIEALQRGVAQFYPPVEGFPFLKEALSSFVEAFVGVKVPTECCVPTVGSMQGGMAAFLVTNRCHADRQRLLFIDPGFPVQKQQLRMLGFEYDTFDVYNHRGAAPLTKKLTEYLEKGHTSAILYSNPNNPSWVCLTEEELEAIGKLATKYQVPVIEDLAYFAMDFRKDLSRPYKPPYQATVARYTDMWLMLISGSKAFSYAGQRVGSLVVSPTLFKQEFPNLKHYFPGNTFGRALIYGALYGLSSGVAASVQHGFAALLDAAVKGQYDFVADVREYERRAARMKEIFQKHGFRVVYDRDGDQPLADGFYFTIGYPGLGGGELLYELIRWGITAIALSTTGSERTEGLRACVSFVSPHQYEILEQRLTAFHSYQQGRGIKG